jgi:hypothetical protein
MSNVEVVYNSNTLTPHCNQADVQSTLGQLEVTNLDSTAKEFLAEPAEWTIRMGGFWSHTLDAFLAPDAVTPGTKRTAVISFTNTSTVSYTWTLNAEISNYQITSTPTGLIAWSAELRLSGAPTRAVV